MEAFGQVSRSGRVGSHGNSVFYFIRNPTLIPIEAAQVYAPTSERGSACLTSSPAFIFCSLDDGHSDWGGIELQMSYSLHVSAGSDVCTLL